MIKIRFSYKVVTPEKYQPNLLPGAPSTDTKEKLLHVTPQK